jgi:DNA-binding transcriptional LysR family regulator
MSDLKSYVVFAETVSAGSMSAAARRLGMSASAVSQTIRALERVTGVTLLHRSTRKLALTEAGERCYPHCLRLIEAASAAQNSLVHARHAPIGELRIAAPVGFAMHLTPALAPVLADWPQLRLRLLVDDAMIDLIDARIDIAIRVGALPDSSWIATPLCELDVVVCASPGYIEQHGTPGSPTDLARRHWLSLAPDTSDASIDEPHSTAIEFRHRNGGHQQIQIAARIVSNNMLTVQQMCEQGMGMARLGLADVLPSLRRGALVRVLPEWRLASMPVTALTARRSAQPAKVRLAMQALRRYFASFPRDEPKPPTLDTGGGTGKIAISGGAVG